MGATPVVKGLKLRATKIDACGKPIEGAGNRLVTDGFISVKVEPVMKERQELEQTNAEGRVCVSDTTPATRKHYKVDISLCGVDPELHSMFTGYEKVLDWEDKVVGFGDLPEVDDKFGVALEVWTGGKSDDDCPVPTTDDIFSITGSGQSYGYLLIGGTEWVPGGFSVEAAVANFTLSGITVGMSRWGRGVYNVAAIDKDLTAGRLLQPIPAKRHLTFFRTPIAPPEVTDGAVDLKVQSIFTAPDTHYYGPDPVDVAPEQDAPAPFADAAA